MPRTLYISLKISVMSWPRADGFVVDASDPATWKTCINPVSNIR